MKKLISLITIMCITICVNAQIIKLYNGDKLVKSYSSSEVTDIVFEKAPVIQSKYFLTGNPNGWNCSSNTMFYCLGDGIFSYTTYFKGAWDLKFWEDKYLGDWSHIWGANNGDGSESGSLIFGEEAGAFQAPSAGYWTLTLNMLTNSYTWTPVNESTQYSVVSISGDFNNWGDLDMTQISPSNGDTHNWYAEITLRQPTTLKFHPNHSWSVSWGSKTGTAISGNIYYGETGIDAITVPASTYKCYLNDITGQWSMVDEYPNIEVATPPSKISLNGNCIPESFSSGKDMAQIYGFEGEFYTMVYSDGGNYSKFKCIINNESLGFTDFDEVNDNANAGIKDADGTTHNIQLSNPGWYIVYITTQVYGKTLGYALNIEKASDGVVGGTFGDDSWGCILMDTPTNKSEWITSVATAEGEMRAFVKVPNRDWWRTEFTVHNGSIYYRDVDIPSNWAESLGIDYSVQLKPGQKVKFDFDTNTAIVE